MNLSPEIILIRHCAASGQEPHAPLTEVGIEQAHELAEVVALQMPKRIVSSPYIRAISSIAPLAEKLGLPVETDERLVEGILGDLPNNDWVVALRKILEEPNFRYPNGACLSEDLPVAKAVIDEVSQHGDFPIVLVTHGYRATVLAKSCIPEIGFEFWQDLKNPDVFFLNRGPQGYSITRGRE